MSTREYRAVVIVASNRAAAGVYEDRSGPIIRAGLETLPGFSVEAPNVVPDGAPVAEALSRALDERRDVAITTGGTGLTPGDETPEATRSLLSYEIPGIAEALRAAGRDKGIASAVLSRGVAGVAERADHRMLVINLPGSSGGVRDGMEVLRPILAHAIDQMNGGDHPREQN